MWMVECVIVSANKRSATTDISIMDTVGERANTTENQNVLAAIWLHPNDHHHDWLRWRPIFIMSFHVQLQMHPFVFDGNPILDET